MNVKAVDKCTNDGSDQIEQGSWSKDQGLTTVKGGVSKAFVNEVNTLDDERLESETCETNTLDDGALQRQSGENEPEKGSFLQTLLEVYEKTKTIIIGLFSVLCGLFIWHLATEYNFNFYINFENIPSPLAVGTAFVTQLGDSEFYIHILVSMKRILFAYSIAVVLGVALGLIVGRSRSIRAAVLPYIEIIRPIPAVAWIPLAILMWPTEESSIIYITFLGALFPIILNTVHGVEQTPEVLVRAALSLGAKRSQVFRHVVFPAALPSIAAGLAIGMGVSWFSLLAGEIISGQYGIGYFTWNAYSLINYPDIVVGMLVIGGLGSLSTFLVRLAMRPSLRWKHSQR
jgi:NitT/TauT family transport system permease protein